VVAGWQLHSLRTTLALGCKFYLLMIPIPPQIHTNTIASSLHCHIAWHVSEGLGMQFVESPDKIQYPPASEFSQTCNNWNSYYKNAFWKKHDSGL